MPVQKIDENIHIYCRFENMSLLQCLTCRKGVGCMHGGCECEIVPEPKLKPIKKANDVISIISGD